jgi:hypothetical protein
LLKAGVDVLLRKLGRVNSAGAATGLKKYLRNRDQHVRVLDRGQNVP